MFSTRRLAKRSIIGTRVSAQWSDARWYPGQIQSTTTWPNGEEVYTIYFDEGLSKVYRESDIIGPGFQPITSASLRWGQKVFFTHQGREVKGVVRRHNRDGDLDDITIELAGSGQDWPTGSPVEEIQEVHRRLEEVRLLESRRSARLQDHGDQDYSRMADLFSGGNNPFSTSDNKKRTVSHVIDVPLPAPKLRRRKASSSPSPEPELKMEEAESPLNIMDEHAAAMVLTSLSCSPVSPVFPATLTDKGCSPGGSSGVWGMKSEPGTPSPPQLQLSQSVPTAPVFGSSPVDEGIELDDTAAYFDEEHTSKKKRPSTRTVFKCTWPGCGKIINTCSAIENHVRNVHLRKDHYDSDSDHEEEFYYTEVEVSVDTVTQTFADMNTSSPPQNVGGALMERDALGAMPQMLGGLPDHDYQKKVNPVYLPFMMPKESAKGGGVYAASFPTINIPPFTRGSPPAASLAQGNGSRFTKSAERLTGGHGASKSGQALSSSPKNSPMHKKTRSEVKKCRKVYGMENRDMWCTQCKWKKACSRFMD